MTTLANFKSQFGGGFASPARYKVTTSNLQGKTREWLPESITTPSRSFVTFNDATYGTVKQIPYKSQYSDEIVMTIVLSESNNERSYFEYWQQALVSSQTHAVQTALSWPENQMLTITTLSRTDKPTSQYTVFGAYPSSILPSNYGYGMQNETAKFQITFNYYKYEYSVI
jgi:hypothetical protein